MLLLQERWVLFIVHALLAEPLGFNEISRRATGVSPATLSQRLDLLEREGLLTKRVISTMPPRTEYRLTPEGEALRSVVQAVEAWALNRQSAKNSG
jgi:DNA-binding HxlR family transcriptional regulator